MEDFRRIAPQDQVAVRGREIQLFDQRIRVFDGLIRSEGIIRPDHYAVGAYQTNQEAQSFGIKRDRVVMKSADVLLEWPLQVEFVPF